MTDAEILATLDPEATMEDYRGSVEVASGYLELSIAEFDAWASAHTAPWDDPFYTPVCVAMDRMAKASGLLLRLYGTFVEQRREIAELHAVLCELGHHDFRKNAPPQPGDTCAHCGKASASASSPTTQPRPDQGCNAPPACPPSVPNGGELGTPFGRDAGWLASGESDY